MRMQRLGSAFLLLAVAGCEIQNPNLTDPTGSPSFLKGGSSSFLDLNGLAAKEAELVLIGTTYSFTEGPAADHFGNVFFSDQPNDRIHRWERSTGELTEFLEGTGRANGMAFDQDGFLIAAADMNGELWSIDENGNHTTIVDDFEGKLLNGPNDLWIAPDGGIYFTDPRFVRNYWNPADPRRTASQQGGEGVYYLSPDRQTLSRVKMFPNGSWPNGIIGTPDGETLYLAVMRPVGQSPQGGRGRILAFDIEPDASLSNERIFVDRRRDPDGMTIDQWGNVYVAGGSIGIDAYSPAGDRIFHVPTGEGWTANVTFGGPNLKTLFITAGTKIFTLDMHVRGAN